MAHRQRQVRRLATAFTVAALAFGSFAPLAGAQEEGGAPPTEGEEPAWVQAAKPGPAHEQLAKQVGSWEVDGKFWMAPDQPPMESKGTSTVEAMLGGRFVKQEYSGDFMGETFQGFGVTGYDNLKKKFVSIWMDSMGTSMYEMEGDFDESTDVITLEGVWPDPMTGGTIPVKSETRWEGEDKMIYTTWFMHEGEWGKGMELTYTRKK